MTEGESERILRPYAAWLAGVELGCGAGQHADRRPAHIRQRGEAAILTHHHPLAVVADVRPRASHCRGVARGWLRHPQRRRHQPSPGLLRDPGANSPGHRRHSTGRDVLVQRDRVAGTHGPASHSTPFALYRAPRAAHRSGAVHRGRRPVEGTMWVSVSSWATTDDDVEKSLEAILRIAASH